MYSRNATVIVLALFLILFCDTTSSECKQVAPCVCSLPDGDYYNLSGLANEKLLAVNEYNWTVYFQPCKNVKIDVGKNNICANVSLCLYNNGTNSAQSLGTIEETRMKLSGKNNKRPVFEIHHNNTTSVINIQCFTDSQTEFTIDGTIPPAGSNEYLFFLSSPYGCKMEPRKALSTGSVLVICFFTIVGTYFIGGIVALRTLRGATGWEMLPNYHFWHTLPGLVKDGVIFTFNCCRADSYERI